MNEIKEYTEIVFEDIKHIDEFGNEYWLARELQNVLGYHQWRSINDLIKRAKVACKESKYYNDNHFALQRKMVDIGSKTIRNVIDYKLSRYACYLIVMNGNPKKEIIALAQTYFAIQTRKQELSGEEYSEKIFEDIKHIDELGNEYWYARELGKILEYGEYRKFLPSIKKATISCEKSGQNVDNHFAQMDVMVDIGSNAKRKLKDYRLTRYACYLIVQNSDSSKPVVALGQTYFAIQTRNLV